MLILVQVLSLNTELEKNSSKAGWQKKAENKKSLKAVETGN